MIELTWIEAQELVWWAEHPTATEAEFEAEFEENYNPLFLGLTS